MGTIFAVVGSNLIIGYFEENCLLFYRRFIQRDLVVFFIRNYFQISDDVFHEQLIQFNIQDFHKIMNELDSDLQFIFEELTKNISFLDINLKIINCILMYAINLQILSVIFTIIVVTHRTQKTILQYDQPDALSELLMIPKMIDFKGLKTTY